MASGFTATRGENQPIPTIPPVVRGYCTSRLVVGMANLPGPFFLQFSEIFGRAICSANRSCFATEWEETE